MLKNYAEIVSENLNAAEFGQPFVPWNLFDEGNRNFIYSEYVRDIGCWLVIKILLSFYFFRGAKIDNSLLS